MPAPKRNKNAERHGLHSGTLPRGCAYISRTMMAFRKALESAVKAQSRDGRISVYQAAAIHTATRQERHALLCQRWLRLEADKMSPAERLTYSREIARASLERDRCLRLLGLDRGTLPAAESPYQQALEAAAGQPALPDPTDAIDVTSTLAISREGEHHA